MTSIAALTFDLWDTLVFDDSDETERAARGLPPKPEARRRLFADLVRASHPRLAPADVDGAWDSANAWFRHAWKVEHHTPTVAERVDHGLARLGIGRPSGFDLAVDGLERMELDIPPLPLPGVRAGLEFLAARYKLAIVSDAVVTPGRHLRQLLAHYDLRDLFEVFVFSDEAGRSKPDRRVFDLASQGLGVPLAGMVHVGDRESNDVEGPHAVGMRAILFTGAIDRGSDRTRADAVCASFAELPDVVAALGRS